MGKLAGGIGARIWMLFADAMAIVNLHNLVVLTLFCRPGTLSPSHSPHGWWTAIRKQQQHG